MTVSVMVQTNIPAPVPRKKRAARVRRWNDRAYKAYVAVCAEERGLSPYALYRLARIDPTNHQTEAKRSGRSIEQILALADAAEKDPALLIAAGMLGMRGNGSRDRELARQAVANTLASQSFADWPAEDTRFLDRAKLAVLSGMAASLVKFFPEPPRPGDGRKLVEAVLAAIVDLG